MPLYFTLMLAFFTVSDTQQTIKKQNHRLFREIAQQPLLSFVQARVKRGEVRMGQILPARTNHYRKQ